MGNGKPGRINVWDPTDQNLFKREREIFLREGSKCLSRILTGDRATCLRLMQEQHCDPVISDGEPSDATIYSLEKLFDRSW